MISVSTHVLDTERGLPAAGVRVELFSGPHRLAGASTDADGRIGRLADGLQAGTYQLVFDVAGYFAEQGRQSPFLRRLSLEVTLGDDRHYHLPLLLSEYACTTYRGS